MLESLSFAVLVSMCVLCACYVCVCVKCMCVLVSVCDVCVRVCAFMRV